LPEEYPQKVVNEEGEKDEEDHDGEPKD